MQSEVLYGARVSAIFKGAFPIIFAIFLLISSDGYFGGTTPWIALAALIFGLWQMRGAFKPKQLVIDRYGLVYHPPLSGPATSIKWQHVKGFLIKGNDKHSKLICHYLNADNGSAQTLNLGEGWNADGKDVFADKLEKVLAYLEETRQRNHLTTQSAAVTAKRPLVEVVKKPAAQIKPPQAGPSIRSGQVYAKPADVKKPASVSLNSKPNLATAKPVGFALLAAGIGGGVGSAFAFTGACRNGLCGQGVWDVPDARLWIFFVIWAACLWAIWMGMRKLQG